MNEDLLDDLAPEKEPEITEKPNSKYRGVAILGLVFFLAMIALILLKPKEKVSTDAKTMDLIRKQIELEFKEKMLSPSLDSIINFQKDSAIKQKELPAVL